MTDVSLGTNVVTKIAGRSGGLVHLAVTNTNPQPGTIISATYVCNIKKNAGSEDFMWIAAPLEVVSGIRTYAAMGTTVFDLAIQGYRVDSPRNLEAMRHFEYLFSMGAMRAKEYIASQDPAKAAASKARFYAFLSYIANLDENDTVESETKMNLATSEMQSEILLRGIDSEGKVALAALPVKPAWAAQWLANYVVGERKPALRDSFSFLASV